MCPMGHGRERRRKLAPTTFQTCGRESPWKVSACHLGSLLLARKFEENQSCDKWLIWRRLSDSPQDPPGGRLCAIPFADGHSRSSDHTQLVWFRVMAHRRCGTPCSLRIFRRGASLRLKGGKLCEPLTDPVALRSVLGEGFILLTCCKAVFASCVCFQVLDMKLLEAKDGVARIPVFGGKKRGWLTGTLGFSSLNLL
ncbi:hypothetical protein CPAR01_11840 [Colletotrichum paranaense]|uniref:Uncharacterized protein n=1 Tax=Colletotrichum paranaense TaxID=1914294 RepID=A0ABQ9S8A6_9PEZI|nr:uncharacterized protein CPAR01_11840 [Colletotrichum paranaense]KAK1529528.1 hypothetical protein CPAR01_11840 [Colletotrichum paranaense]